MVEGQGGGEHLKVDEQEKEEEEIEVILLTLILSKFTNVRMPTV